jgi:TolB-like protein/Tfp pilus assembly protein PilF
MNGPEQHVIHEFGGYRLDASRRQLFAADGQPVTLTSRVFDTLLYFVEHRGELLDKATLMQAVWPDTVVEENNLNQAISALRRALGEKRDEHRFIVTDPGRGYRFVAEVRTGPDDRKFTTEPAPQRNPTHSKLSIAVLPFVNMSEDPTNEYFSDGIAEELLNHLAKLPDLHVAGRMSSFYFKRKNEDYRRVGEKLNVAHVLEGGVRKAGNRVRITAQLVKVSDGYHLWSESYDRELDDIFAIQEDIAHSVADALEITLGVGELGRKAGMTRNVAAYEDYLTGRSQSKYIERDYYLRAIEHLERAVSLDPDFGLAWGELATVYYVAATLVLSDRAEEYLEQAEQAAARALALAPEAVSSLIAVAQLHIQRREWATAEQTLQKAHTLATADYTINLIYGAFLQSVGRPREAIEYFHQAGRAEPLAVIPAQDAALCHEMLGDVDKALQGFEQAKQLKVGNLAIPDVFILVLALAMDDRALIEASLDKTTKTDNVFLPPGSRALNPTMRSLLDKPETAREALHRFAEDPAYNSQFIRSVVMAIWASYFGADELALKLQYQGDEPSVGLVYALWRPIFKSMRRLPGFKDLVRNLGLVDYWRTTGNWGQFCRPLSDDDFECW